MMRVSEFDIQNGNRTNYCLFLIYNEMGSLMSPESIECFVIT